jgi:hypothetical protein
MNQPIAIQFTRPNWRPARPVAKKQTKDGTAVLFYFIGLHALLGVAFKLVPHFSTLHALVSLAVVLIFAFGRYSLGWVIAGCSYLVGSEAIWRMTDASVFWEFGKYSVILIAVVAMLRRRLGPIHYLPVLYLMLLVPAAVLTLFALSGFTVLRQTLSNDFSGPLAYTICGLFLLGRKVARQDVIRCVAAMLAPILSVAALTFYGVETTQIQYGRSSNLDASGGFGPNQVSEALGLGIVLCFLLFTGMKQKLAWKTVLVGLILWFSIQAALTFSRSGLYFPIAAILAGTVFLVADVRRFVVIVAVGLALLATAKFVVVPRLNTITGGAIEDRFSRTDLSGREYLMRGDFKVFLEHPLFGVGVGLSREARREAIGLSKRSHTEYTRLLSEHGLLGMAALALMLVMSAQCVIFQTPGWPRAFSATLVAFALVFMIGSGMRLAIPAFLLGLAGVRIVNPPRGLFRRAVRSTQPATEK